MLKYKTTINFIIKCRSLKKYHDRISLALNSLQTDSTLKSQFCTEKIELNYMFIVVTICDNVWME